MQRIKGKTCVIFFLFLTACVGMDEGSQMRRENQLREPITRTHDSHKYPRSDSLIPSKEEADG